MLNLLRAIWQADPTFPSGGFAFSNGIEGALATGEEGGSAVLERHVRAALVHRWATADRVALLRAWRAGGDIGGLCRIDAEWEALSTPEPLRTGSRRNGAALVTSHLRLGTPGAAMLSEAIRRKSMQGHLPVVQGALWHGAGLDEAGAVAASAYAALNGMVAAAIRLGRVGAVEAQAVVAACLPLIGELAETPVQADAVMTATTPFLDIAAMRQAHAGLRLFAN